MDAFHLDHAPPFVEQLMSDEALRKTGYFDPAAVRRWRSRLPAMRLGSPKRTAVEMGLVGVTATQPWHQVFIDSTLAEVPKSADCRLPLVNRRSETNLQSAMCNLQ